MRSPILATMLALGLPALALAQRFDGPARSGAYSVELLDESGRILPTFAHAGRVYTLGTQGQRYIIRVRNNSPRRVEVVTSVDGRDVIDGQPSALDKRGYLIAPYGEVTIDGYRTSDESVAAFRFSSVPESYASRWGDDRDVGVIGVAVFSERQRPVPYLVYPPLRPQIEYPPGAEGYPGDRSASSPKSRPAPPPSEPAAPSQNGAIAREEAPGPDRPGLGTEYGEEHFSQVFQVSFERASANPDAVISVRYNDWDGLRALGIDLGTRLLSSGDDTWLRETAQPFRRDYAEAPPPLRPW